MARRLGGSRSRGSISRATRSSSSRSRIGSGGFRPSSTRNVGGYRYRYRPYRRNYFYHSLGPTGKVVYIILVAIIIIFLLIIGY